MVFGEPTGEHYCDTSLTLVAKTRDMVRAYTTEYKKDVILWKKPHTYLDGISPFNYLGLWAVEMLHSTATLSSEGVCGLYGL